MSTAARSISSGFYVMVTGQIDACQVSGYDNLYCKYSFSKGVDWSVLSGLEHGVSQIATRSSGGGGSSQSDVLTWNYPLDILFRSSNVHGWPQIVIGVYGMTPFGGDVVRGYGCTHVPTVPGRYTKYVQLYTPVSSSVCQRLTAWITNNPPEFFDSKFIAQGKGREVTRVSSHGVVKVTFNVTTKNMREWGYQVSNERMGDAGVHSHQLEANLDAEKRGNAAAAANASSSSSSNYGDSQRVVSGAPQRTQLSSTTSAGLAASRQRAALAAAINPPSGSSSRETSVVRRTMTTTTTTTNSNTNIAAMMNTNMNNPNSSRGSGGAGGGGGALQDYDGATDYDPNEYKYPSSSSTMNQRQPTPTMNRGGAGPGSASASLEMQGLNSSNNMAPSGGGWAGGGGGSAGMSAQSATSGGRRMLNPL